MIKYISRFISFIEVEKVCPICVGVLGEEDGFYFPEVLLHSCVTVTRCVAQAGAQLQGVIAFQPRSSGSADGDSWLELKASREMKLGSKGI